MSTMDTKGKLRYVGKKLNLRSLLPSLSFVLYFSSILLVTQIDTGFTDALFYGSVVFGLLCLFLTKRLNMRVFVISLVFLALGMMNIMFVHNLKLIRLLLAVSTFWLSTLYIQEDMDESPALIILFLNAIIVLIHFYIAGVANPVYQNSSNNYVSIYLLAPTVIYYTIQEKNKRNIRIYPALLVLIISFLSGSRMGLISSALLFVGILIYKYFGGRRRKVDKIILAGIIIAVIIAVGSTYFPAFVSRYSNVRVIYQFSSKRLESQSRMILWGEYVNSLSNMKNLLFGTSISLLPYADVLANNLHNSFIFIHAYYGLIGIFILFFAMIYNVVNSIKNKKWIYLICLLSFCLRAFTDHVFGGHRISIVIVFLMLFPILSKSYKRQDMMIL